MFKDGRIMTLIKVQYIIKLVINFITVSKMRDVSVNIMVESDAYRMAQITMVLWRGFWLGIL